MLVTFKIYIDKRILRNHWLLELLVEVYTVV